MDILVFVDSFQFSWSTTPPPPPKKKKKIVEISKFNFSQMFSKICYFPWQFF